jgi:hypothetical protein
MLIAIAIANAVLWSGVIIALLVYLARDSRSLESRISQIESKIGGAEDDLHST